MGFSIFLLVLSSFLNFSPIIVVGGGDGSLSPDVLSPGNEIPLLPPPLAPITITITAVPSPSPLPCSSFLDQRLFAVYPYIQKFKAKITSDPLGITKTWTGPDICNKYKGFYCDNPPDNQSAIALASIDFNGFHLSGTLDGFLENLKDLALFHANSNNFTGIISPKIANLPYLYEFDISNNRFSGTFPPALLAATNITFLDIRFNFFNQSVPAHIFSHVLDVLFLNNNNFARKIPKNFGQTTAFFLTLANNKFTGPIPRSIGKAYATLIEILFLNNRLTGCLPYEMGFLNGLTVLDVGNNRLTGPIPCSFGCLDKIEQLNLAGNLFYGMIPEVVCTLENLQNLSLSDNYFTRAGPLCRKLIDNGVLDVKRNCIRGLPGQRPIGQCTSFFSRERGCPFMESYSFVPCSKPSKPYASWMMRRTPSPLTKKAPSPTYSALIKHP